MVNIEHIQYISAPVAKVYEALSTAHGLAEIWTQELTFDNQLDAINEFKFGDEVPTKMKITELINNKRIAWHCIESDPEWVGTNIIFDLKQSNDKTSITLRHSDWKAVSDFYRFCNYNWAIFLLSLKQYCEEGIGINYQARKF